MNTTQLLQKLNQPFKLTQKERSYEKSLRELRRADFGIEIEPGLENYICNHYYSAERVCPQIHPLSYIGLQMYKIPGIYGSSNYKFDFPAFFKMLLNNKEEILSTPDDICLITISLTYHCFTYLTFRKEGKNLWLYINKKGDDMHLVENASYVVGFEK